MIMFVVLTEPGLSYSSDDLPPTTIKNELLSESESSFSGKYPSTDVVRAIFSTDVHVALECNYHT